MEKSDDARHFTGSGSVSGAYMTKAWQVGKGRGHKWMEESAESTSVGEEDL